MLFPDGVVHLRLSELWLIEFIVPVFAVTDNIDEDIFFKVRMIVHCQTDCSVDVFDVLAIYVDDWDIVGFE